MCVLGQFMVVACWTRQSRFLKSFLERHLMSSMRALHAHAHVLLLLLL